MADAAPASRTMRVCCQTRSQVDGPELCTVCIEPLPLPGPGADVVLMLHACGHCFHRDCGQEVLLNALRKYEKPRCPNCRATLDTAPFGKLLGQRRQPREKRMRNLREIISVSEVRLKAPASARGERRGALLADPPRYPPRRMTWNVTRFLFPFFALSVPLTRADSTNPQEYMKSKNWRVPKRNAVGSSDAQRALAGLIIQSRKDFHAEFGEEA